ncbi:hypothetical protein ALNOE001_12700 [Candidatus Methanobinarius endosymbioticus]|uniref:Uncharacterized protein n=1 Tax=Candidatus Methanobinarius endosymbioticus TaxID=2006182 RepID=A0A366M9Y2_9EURY|nr:hypothetical protein ALNOE001_12700 [Candidatus Methanobinarius endosymbioticus]
MSDCYIMYKSTTENNFKAIRDLISKQIEGTC